jgi:pimeloyl-ACP methyl ester carboxylesterase
MSEQLASANGIELAYETFGDPGDPAMLMIMGLGGQMLHWDAKLCALLAGRGFQVIRYDNRDVGHSTQIDDGPEPNLLAAMAGDTSSASYTLSDMAADAAGLLDHLGRATAHVVGASMGGMIAQTLAIEAPERVLSLTSIMSNTGDPAVGKPAPQGLAALLTPIPSDRDGYIEQMVKLARVVGSPAFPAEDARLRDLFAAVHARGVHPRGFARQLLAIAASGDRTAALAGVAAPTLVIHGEEDVLIDISGARATAAAIPGAELLTIPGMGHDLPPACWPQIVEAIVANAARSASQARLAS